jgi:Ca2+-binding RTX toxin-like protein
MPVITGTNSDDTLVGGSGNDTLNGRDGDDRLSGGGGLDRLFGQLGDDTLFGDDGGDLLHGGLGADRMLGGRGNDAYVVDNAGDVVVEGVSGAAGGHDSVLASVNWTLAANLEDLRLEGSALRGTGNALANALTGNDRNNLLRGLGGDDSLDGGAGADTLDGGNGRDTVVYGFEWESAGFGPHAVRADTPDIVLLDVLMPVLNGDQLADLLRADQDGARVGIILHSSKPTEELSAIVQRVGALGAIRKTADDTGFMNEFDRLVQMRGVRR